MKILHIISSIGMFGAENVLLNLLRLSHEGGHTLHLICLKSADKVDPEIYNRAQRLGVQSEVFPCHGKLDFKVIAKIRRFIAQEGIQVIHSHNYKSNLYGFVVSRLSGVPIVATLHGWTGENRKVKFYEMLDRWLARRIDYRVSVSPAITDELRKHGAGEENTAFIANGVDADAFSPSCEDNGFRREFGLEDSFVLGTVGRLGPEKGHSYLIAAFKEVYPHIPNVKLLIVGDGQLKNALKSQAYNLGVGERVIFTGEQRDMPSVYKFMDIFILPSLSEGIPMALLEAMSMGIPVIATKVGGVPYVVGEDEGILIQPASVKDLKSAILSLSVDASSRNRICQRAREKVMTHFSLAPFYQQYAGVYQNIEQSKT